MLLICVDDALGTACVRPLWAGGDVRKLSLAEKEVGLLLLIGDPNRGLSIYY